MKEQCIKTNELVYFTGEEKRILDFTGKENSFSLKQREDFLKHYKETSKQWYQDFELNQKACSNDEVAEFLEGFKSSPLVRIRREIAFDKMDACSVYKEPEFNNLHLYCGAYMEENEIVLKERFVRPTPFAKLDFPQTMENMTVSFAVYIPYEYKCTQNERSGGTQPSRIIEIRNKTLDIVKINLYNTGEICARSKDMWEPDCIYLADVKFGDWNTFDIELGETATITVNGKTTAGIVRTVIGEADNLCFDGGMFPAGGWKVKDIKINNIPFIATKNNKKEKQPLFDKEVTLPYAIGGYENRDSRIYLKKTFDAGSFVNAVLKIETLDPCGKVWLNGHLILDADGFMAKEICVSDYLKTENNELIIMVEPRPPEVYYYWHRHTDCYNGWFCGEVSLILTDSTYLESMQVSTTDISDEVKARVQASLNQYHDGEAELFISPSYPETGLEKSLGKTTITGKDFIFDFNGDFLLWDTKNPNLYVLRLVIYDKEGNPVDDMSVETGFRMIEQKNGAVYLNNKRVLLNGALLMQFLPPFKDVPINHNCSTDEQIAMQALMLKKMNGSLLRLHLLGYGTNDARYAKICDRLGIMLIWTTRLIDTLESLVWDGPWQEEKMYIQQIKAVINHPSIIMYEGSNEYHSMDLHTIDRMYNEFTTAIDRVDKTRLLSPCSHLYYSGKFCYYNNDGTKDNQGNSVQSDKGWLHPRVVRSAHTYAWLCGYGQTWEDMRKQEWIVQDEAIQSDRFSYLITEYAITALANPNTDEAKSNPYIESYERPDENGAFGRIFKQEEWQESQALQALCAFNATKLMRLRDVDGMAWCCLTSGANNGSYLKPPIDFYGYKKLGYYALREAFRDIYACNKDVYISYGTKDSLVPAIINTSKEGNYSLKISIIDESGDVIDKKVYNDICVSEKTGNIELEAFKPAWHEEGYYQLQFELTGTSQN